jgi:hypothetical protein
MALREVMKGSALGLVSVHGPSLESRASGLSWCHTIPGPSMVLTK